MTRPTLNAWLRMVSSGTEDGNVLTKKKQLDLTQKLKIRNICPELHMYSP